MSRINVANFRHPDATADSITLTSGGGTEIGGLTYPTSDGTNGQYLQTNGSGALSWQTVTDTTGNDFQIASGDLTSVSTVTLTGIDPDAVKLVLTFENVSSGTSNSRMRIRLGNASGGGTISTSGYHYNNGYYGSSNGSSYYNSEININNGFDLTSNVIYGRVVFNKHSANYWIVDHTAITTNTGSQIMGGVGYANAGGTLDRMQIYNSSGANFTRGTYTLSEYRE